VLVVEAFESVHEAAPAIAEHARRVHVVLVTQWSGLGTISHYY